MQNMKILSETTYFATSAIILRRYVSGAVCLQAKPVDDFTETAFMLGFNLIQNRLALL